jgi:hypothetical protein
VDNFTPKRVVDKDLSGSVVRQRESVSVSLQVQIMLVLSGHPNGRATLAAMNADLKVLAGAGPAWTQRIKKLSSNAPGLDIFTEGYVVRDAHGWQITDAGRKALRRMHGASSEMVTEHAAPCLNAKPAIAIVATGTFPAANPSATVINIADRRYLPRLSRLSCSSDSEGLSCDRSVC